MKKEIQFLQDRIHPNTCGLLWVTQQKLEERPKPFYALNYFFDGLLVNFCLEEQKKEGPLPNLFLTKNFDRNLFLGHFNQFIPSLEEKVKTFLDIAENIAEEGSKILIVSEEKELPLKKHFKERKYFQFENLQTLSSSKAFN